MNTLKKIAVGVRTQCSRYSFSRFGASKRMFGCNAMGNVRLPFVSTILLPEVVSMTMEYFTNRLSPETNGVSWFAFDLFSFIMFVPFSGKNHLKMMLTASVGRSFW